jgi:predicted Zn-dependent protease
MSELHTSRHFADVASRPISIGIVRSLDSGERLTSNIKEDFTLVFETKVVAELMQPILACFSYKKILNKESFLHRHIGKRIGSKKLHVIDDASLPNGVNTRAFDARGVPPIARTLICEGVVRDFYISSNDAVDSENKPTGHMGLDGNLWPGNIIIKAGRRSLNMILSADESTIFCTHLLEPIKFDEETGDIEMLLGCSMVREEKRRRLHGIRISTDVVNIFDAIDEVASTQRRIDSVDASDWVIRNLDVQFLQEDPEV